MDPSHLSIIQLAMLPCSTAPFALDGPSRTEIKSLFSLRPASSTTFLPNRPLVSNMNHTIILYAPDIIVYTYKSRQRHDEPTLVTQSPGRQDLSVAILALHSLTAARLDHHNLLLSSAHTRGLMCKHTKGGLLHTVPSRKLASNQRSCR